MRTKAPLAESYREAPLWWDGAPPASEAAHDLPRETDVVVIGSGYTGMMAAGTLAGKGLTVAVLEQHELGWGASSRNGGMVHPGFKVGASTLLRRYGDRGLQLYRSSVDAFRLVEKTIQDCAIDCDYQRSGHISLAYRPGHMAHLEAESRFLDQRFELKTEIVSREALAAEVGSTLYHGGLLVETSGGLHPARYHAGLTRIARQRGARLFDRAKATAIQRQGAGFRVESEQGAINCAHVLVATNGYSDRLLPAVRRRIIPIGSYLIATEPISEGLVQATIPGRRMLFDTKNFLYYWRLGPDNRMLFGGRASFAPTSVASARDWLYSAMVRVHPQLRGVRVERAWGGQLGFTFDRIPHIGRIDGVTYSLGYCGTGVALSTYLGRLAAEWISGNDLPSCWRGNFPTMPLYHERPWFLRPAGWYYGLLDRL